MKNQELIEAGKKIINTHIRGSEYAKLAEAKEYLRTFAGEDSEIYLALRNAWIGTNEIDDHVSQYIGAFIRYIENGLLNSLSPERQAQIDVVSDFLSQAETLLGQKDVHPAAPTVLIGASLEEFLRNWVEATPELSIGDQKPGIEAFASTLRKADLVTKQDVKDITSWGGMRNDAAHGIWENVNDKQKITLMLQGVNLFMRKYSPQN